MEHYKCPDCGADLLDWRNFSEKTPLDEEKPFECTGFRCDKRWNEQEILQRESKEQSPLRFKRVV